MHPLFKLVIIIIIAWVLLTQFVPMIVGVPAIVSTLVTVAIVLGVIYLGWKIIEAL